MWSLLCWFEHIFLIEKMLFIDSDFPTSSTNLIHCRYDNFGVRAREEVDTWSWRYQCVIGQCRSSYTMSIRQTTPRSTLISRPFFNKAAIG